MLTINILIGDRSYRIKVEPQNEEVVRKAVKTINEQITEFRSQFAGKDMQDYIAMVLIWFATAQLGDGDSNALTEGLRDYLDELEKSLDLALTVPTKEQ